MLTKVAKGYCKVVDTISEVLAYIGGWMIFVLVFLLTLECVRRNVFNNPTLWSYEVSYILGGSAALMGIPFCLKDGGQIRMDVIYDRFPKKLKAVWDIIFSLILFYPLVVLSLTKMFPTVATSVAAREVYRNGALVVPYWPLKVVILVSFCCLFLQHTAKTIRDIQIIAGKDGDN